MPDCMYDMIVNNKGISIESSLILTTIKSTPHSAMMIEKKGRYGSVSTVTPSGRRLYIVRPIINGIHMNLI